MASENTELVTGIQNLFGTEGLQINRDDVSDIFVSDFLSENLMRQEAVKQRHSQAQQAAEEANDEADDLMEEDAKKRAQRFQTAQTSALKVWEVREDDIKYCVTASVVVPERPKGKAKNGPLPYEYYRATVEVDAGKAVANWSGTFRISREFKLSAKAVRLLQERDELRKEAKEAMEELQKLKVEESSGPQRLRTLVNGAVAKCRIEAADGGQELINMVMEKATQSPVLALTYASAETGGTSRVTSRKRLSRK